MNTVELFSGTKSFSKVMAAHDHDTFTIDNSMRFRPDICADILDIDELPPKIDILWASPPCTTFSVASFGKHWTGGKKGYIPKTGKAAHALVILEHTLELINNSDILWWFVENPVGMMRKTDTMNQYSFLRHTVTYCQYGAPNMKPTDIWTNASWWKPKPRCKNGDKCHQAAPRGSKTGTQGLNGAMARGVIPPALFEEILEQMP